MAKKTTSKKKAPLVSPYKEVDSSKADLFRMLMPVPDNVAQMAAKTLYGDARMSNKSLSNNQKLILWNTIKNAQKRSGKMTGGGTEYQDYGNQGYGSPEEFNEWFNRGKISTVKGLYNSLTNPGFKLASTIGRGRYWQDPKDPDIIEYTDVYDWNPSEKNFKGVNPYQIVRNYVRDNEEKNLNADKNENYRMNFRLSKKEIDEIQGIEPEKASFDIHRTGGWLDKYEDGGQLENEAKNYTLNGKNVADSYGQRLDSLSSRLRNLQMQQTDKLKAAYPLVPIDEILDTANKDKAFRNSALDQKADSLQKLYGDIHIPVDEEYMNTVRDYNKTINKEGYSQQVIGNEEKGLKNFGYRSMMYKYFHDSATPAYKSLEEKENGGEVVHPINQLTNFVNRKPSKWLDNYFK